jgi:hypothetical protein
MYDTVFKRLMENDRVVKFFIGTLLEEEVISVDIRPQEYTHKDDIKKIVKAVKNKHGKTKNTEISIAGLGYSVYRVDFMATIKTKEGKPKKILIEVQKGSNENDVLRFRNYLAEQYKKKDEVDGITTTLPIITIYVLGFNLTGIDSPCVKVDRNYIDLINHQPINAKTPFMEKLTHDSYVIQAKKIAIAHYRTKLEQLLGIFEQTHFTDETSGVLKQYYHQSDDEDIQLMTTILHEMGADPKERKKIEIEAEALRILDDLYGGTLREKEKALEEKDKALEEKDKALEEKDKTIKEKDKALEETRKANEEQAKRIAELERILKGKQE